MILFVRGGIGAWPEDGGRFATMEDATLTKLRGSVVAGGAFFWIWLVVGATLRQRPDWGPPSMTPLQVDAGCFSVFLLFTGAHMWLQHSLEPTRATLGCISARRARRGSGPRRCNSARPRPPRWPGSPAAQRSRCSPRAGSKGSLSRACRTRRATRRQGEEKESERDGARRQGYERRRGTRLLGEWSEGRGEGGVWRAWGGRGGGAPL